MQRVISREKPPCIFYAMLWSWQSTSLGRHGENEGMNALSTFTITIFASHKAKSIKKAVRQYFIYSFVMAATTTTNLRLTPLTQAAAKIRAKENSSKAGVRHQRAGTPHVAQHRIGKKWSKVPKYLWSLWQGVQKCVRVRPVRECVSISGFRSRRSM